MNPKDEGKDLLQRVIKLGDSVTLTVISLLQLIVQTGILFFTVWITVFTKGKKLADRTTAKISDKINVPMTLFQKEN